MAVFFHRAPSFARGASDCYPGAVTHPGAIMSFESGSLHRLELPWSGREHPRKLEHQAAAQQLAESAGLLETAEAARRFAAFVRLDSYVYPHFSKEALLAAGAFNHWLYFLDDQYDENPGFADRLEAVREMMRRAFEAMLWGRTRDDATAFERYTVQVRRLLDGQAFDGWMPGFLQHVHSYMFEGSMRSIAVWRSGHTPGLEEYYRLRALDSGTYTVLHCSMLACGQALPDEVLDHPMVKELLLHANLHVSFANDLFSYQKEVLRHGYPCNLVQVVRHQHRLSQDDAVAQSIDLVNEELRRFVELRDGLPRFGAETDASLSRWVEGMQTWMRGNVDYSLRSRRFNAPDSPFPELRHTRTISMEIPLIG